MYTVTLFNIAFASFALATTTLPIELKFQLPDGMTLPARDRLRRQYLSRLIKRENVGATNDGIHYSIPVKVGSPPTTYNLMLDSGSGYTWLGAQKKYVQTKTSRKQPQTFYANYASGSAVGDNYKDTVAFSPALSISNKSIGVASSVNGFKGYDGILGLGPTALAQVLTPNTHVPTVMDALLAQRKINQNVFGLAFAPSRGPGSISFGGVDKSKHTGALNWVGVTRDEAFEGYWAYDQAIKYGNQTLQETKAGIVDTGTTLVYITPKAFKTYTASLAGSKIDSKTGLLEIPKESVGKMSSLLFVINGVEYEFTPNAQLWPRSLNTALGGKKDAYYSIIGALTDFEADTGSSFVNGYVFLERFYTAYDATNRKIGFATTSSTYSNAN